MLVAKMHSLNAKALDVDDLLRRRHIGVATHAASNWIRRGRAPSLTADARCVPVRRPQALVAQDYDLVSDIKDTSQHVDVNHVAVRKTFVADKPSVNGVIPEECLEDVCPASEGTREAHGEVV